MRQIQACWHVLKAVQVVSCQLTANTRQSTTTFSATNITSS